MAFCLSCHRHHEEKLRPPDRITDLNWKPQSPEEQREFGRKALAEWKVESLENCSACHR
jgi:mono/diheme cytochrome c family protein